MTGGTHAAVGLFVGVLLTQATGEPSAWVVGATTLGALLPDLDEPRSTATRLPQRGARFLQRGLPRSPLKLCIRVAGALLTTVSSALATFVRAIFGHRGATHSLVAVILSAAGTMALGAGLALAAPPWSPSGRVVMGSAVGLSVGYLSSFFAP